MKRLVMFLAAVAIAAQAHAVVVVLTGGKRVEVASYSVNASYVTVQYANGRREAYPVTAVDLQATKAANGEATPAAQPTPETGPHSPFLAAKSSGKGSSLVVTDADVQHLEPSEAEQEGEKKDEQTDSGGQVVLVSYEKRASGKGEWDITAIVQNQGKYPVQNVNAVVRVLDTKGKPLAGGSGTMAGKLDPGKQGTLTAHVVMEGEPAQVAFDLTWQEIKPVPTPGPVKQQPAGAAVPTAAPKPVARIGGAGQSATASPNSLAANPLTPVSPNAMGTAPQAAPEAPPQPAEPK